MNWEFPELSEMFEFEFDTNYAQRPVAHDLDANVNPENHSNISETPISTLPANMKAIHATSCDNSDQVCSSTTNLPNDVETIHSTGEPPRFPCTIPGCEKTYKNKRHISLHVKTDHVENPVRFRCTLCEKEFKTMSNLGNHRSTHANVKPFKCATCGGNFAQKSVLIRHETTHLDKSSREIFKCHLCPVTSFRNCNLQRHIEVVHENRRAYSCSYCEKKLASVRGLKRHVEARHSENKEVHSCDKCEYKAHLKHDLAQHVRNHHIANTFDCDLEVSRI